MKKTDNKAKEEKKKAEATQQETVEQQTEKTSEQTVEEIPKEPTAEELLAAEKDKYLRLAAEFDNYRRRAAKERLELIGTASEEVLTGFLPVLDDCQRALDVLDKSTDSAAAKEGTELIYNKLYSYLKSKGVEQIEAVGKDFDTDFHEAVAQFPVDDKKKKNKIIDVVQNGYTLNGKVIRFAKVVVGI